MKPSTLTKIASLLPELEQRGTVYLYAVGERADIDLWDVVLSSSWSDDGFAPAVKIVAEALTKILDPSELRILSRVAIIPSGEANIRDLPLSLDNITPEDKKVIDYTLAGLEFRRVFILRAQRPVSAELAGAGAGSLVVGA